MFVSTYGLVSLVSNQAVALAEAPLDTKSYG